MRTYERHVPSGPPSTETTTKRKRIIRTRRVSHRGPAPWRAAPPSIPSHPPRGRAQADWRRAQNLRQHDRSVSRYTAAPAREVVEPEPVRAHRAARRAARRRGVARERREHVLHVKRVRCPLLSSIHTPSSTSSVRVRLRLRPRLRFRARRVGVCVRARDGKWRTSCVRCVAHAS